MEVPQTVDWTCSVPESASPPVAGIRRIAWRRLLVPDLAFVVSLKTLLFCLLLFDGTLHRVTGLRMTLRRVLKDSDAYSMPWARRGQLERAVHVEIVRVALGHCVREVATRKPARAICALRAPRSRRRTRMRRLALVRGLLTVRPEANNESFSSRCRSPRPRGRVLG